MLTLEYQSETYTTMQLKPGTLLQGGKYKIVRFIKSGGFGCTYEAWNTVFEERVAIKEFFPKDFCNREDATLHVTVGTHSKKPLVDKLRNKFIDEAKAIRKLSHSGIVKVSDVFEENGTAYYVMDYIDGCSLDDLVKHEGALSEQAALGYIRQVCSALDYVHSQNRLHLDIKPGNIMVDRSGHAILIDFGTSKQYDEENGENTSTLLGMTPGYAPLEQYKKGGVTKFSPATDVYSLGATLYKLLTGQIPPEADDIYEDGIPDLPSSLSSSVRNAVQQAMSPRRKDRPQSVGEFLSMIGATSDNERVDVIDNKSINSDLLSDEETKRLDSAVHAMLRNEEIYIKNNILVIHGVEYPMVEVAGGEFMMGESHILGDDRRHDVRLDSYSIGRYLVTQDLWETVMGSNPSRFKGPRRPVEQVSWYDCQDFIRKLNELTGANFRLPTEAEWEFAARGGNSSRGYKYSGSDALDDVAWYYDNSGDKTHDVGTKSPNELGLYDMSGNVFEWCNDRYGSYSSSSQTNPKGASSGSRRVFRGGSWSNIAWYCRVSYRRSCAPGYRYFNIGLRLCH